MKGKFVRAIRAQLKMTRKQLAERVGVNWRTVEGWENGRPPSPMAMIFLNSLVAPKKKGAK